MSSSQIVTVILTIVGYHILNSCNSVSNDPICEEVFVLHASAFNQDRDIMQNNELYVSILGHIFLQLVT